MPAQEERLSDATTIFVSTIFALILFGLGLGVLGHVILKLWNVLRSPATPHETGLGMLFGQLAAGAVMFYFAYHSARLKRVFLKCDRIRVAGPWRTVEIPLSEIDDVIWIVEPKVDDTPEAALLLRSPCMFGSEIRFAPRSIAAFNALRQSLHASRLGKSRS